MVSSARLLDPEQIAVRAGLDPAFLVLPAPATLFGERAMRWRQLAAGHAMADYLLFAAALAQAQHAAASEGPAPEVPQATVFEQAAAAGTPPLPIGAWWQDDTWHATFARLIDHLHNTAAAALPTAVDDAARCPRDERNRLAQRLLHGHLLADDLALAPLIGAALQVHGARLVAAAAQQHAGLRGGAFGRTDDPHRCPCCGGPPTASVLRIDGTSQGLRYLHCAACATQWHLMRITCALCGNAAGLDYRQLQPAQADQTAATPATVRAECCPACHGYLKLVAQDRDPHADPVADDLATLTLDLLLGEAGLQRLGVNFLLLFSDAAAPPLPP
jgi:FdhE protein